MKKSYTLAELSSLTGATQVGDTDTLITGVNTLEEATPTDLSFLSNPRYSEALKKSKGAAFCVSDKTPLEEGKNYLVSLDPSRTFQKVVELLLPQGTSGFTGIHPTAVIHPTAKIGPNVTIGPYVVIDRDTTIGEGTTLLAHVSIGFEVTIGRHCLLHPHSTVREKCRLGDRVTLQPGAVIGSCGFGYILDSTGKHAKLEQLGIVVLEDDVEIGANTTIDRSRFKETIVRKGSKIDNLVQVGHNVEVGEHNVIAAQTGIAGSAKTGKYVMIGGQAGIVGHIEIDDQTMIATRSGVSKSLKKGTYRGSPAMQIHDYHRQEVHIRKIEEYLERIKTLEKKLNN
jgi:UDP-3-O-[3-hydroxymyristoyl] glucosamine N-acyltransferase